MPASVALLPETEAAVLASSMTPVAVTPRPVYLDSLFYVLWAEVLFSHAGHVGLAWTCHCELALAGLAVYHSAKYEELISTR